MQKDFLKPEFTLKGCIKVQRLFNMNKNGFKILYKLFYLFIDFFFFENKTLHKLFLYINNQSSKNYFHISSKAP